MSDQSAPATHSGHAAGEGVPIQEQIKLAMDKAAREQLPEETPEEELVTEDATEPSEDEGLVEEVEVEEAEAEETEETTEAEVDQEEDSEDPEESEDLDLMSQLVTVKINGEEHEVTVEELSKGYQRLSDYTRKTKEVAAQREQLGQAMTAYEGAVRSIAESLADDIKAYQRLDWDALRAQDINEYNRQYTNAQKAVERYKSAVAAIEEVGPQKSTVQQEIDTEKQAQELSALAIHFPELQDLQSEKAQNKTKSWFDYAQEDLGFTPEELQAFTDHRLFILLDKAVQLKNLLNEQTQIREKKVKKVPKKVKKAGQPEAKTEDTLLNEKRAEALSKLKTSGSIRDAAEYLKTANIL